MSTLRQALEKYAESTRVDDFSDAYANGQMAMLDLLWPVIEGMQEYAKEEGSGHKTHYWAEHLLAELEAKLEKNS